MSEVLYIQGIDRITWRLNFRESSQELCEREEGRVFAVKWVQFSPPEAIAPWQVGMIFFDTTEPQMEPWRCEVTAVDRSAGRIRIEPLCDQVPAGAVPVVRVTPGQLVEMYLEPEDTTDGPP